MATVTLHTPTDLVAVAFIRSIMGLTADVVATQLPADEASWAKGGAVVIPTGVGGSPHQYIPVRRPVLQLETWATNLNSSKLPWNKANQLASQIIAATYDRVNFGRALNITANGVQYPVARALSAQALNEPRRIWSDVGDYAGFTFDLVLHWVAAGEVVP